MKHSFTAFASAVLAAFAVHASPMATEAWVRSYVATNAVSKQTSSTTTISATMEIDGEEVTSTMTLSTSKEPAWVISESTVTGMPVGVHFAIDGCGNACNYTNTACPVIYQSVSQNWQRVTRRVSGGVTNVVTNVISVARLDFRVNGIDYMGFEDPVSGTVDAAGITNATGVVTFSKAYVTPRVRNILITPPAQTSWLSLFFGTAYAGWNLDSEWAEDGDPTVVTLADGTIVTTYNWLKHYHWDGNGGIIEVTDITVKGKEYYPTYSKTIIAKGTDYCDAKEPSPEAIKAEIYAAVLEAIPNDKANQKFRVIFQRFMNAGEYDDSILALIESVCAEVFTGLECPQRNTTTTETKPESDEETVVDPPTPAYCGHYNVKCYSTQKSCVFRCVTCKKEWKYAHYFQNSSTHCAVCSRAVSDGAGRSVKCGIASDNPDYHCFTPKQGGTDFGCWCIHHGVWGPHPSFCNTTGWKYDQYTHYKEHECTRCGKVLQFDADTHYLVRSAPYYYPDRCETSNECYRCAYAEFAEVVGHVPTMYFHTMEDDDYHFTRFYCGKCKRLVDEGENQHVPDGETVECKYLDNVKHKVFWRCKGGTNGCGATYHAYDAKHTPDSSYGDEYRVCQTNENLHEMYRKCQSGTNGCGQIYLVKGSTHPHVVGDSETMWVVVTSKWDSTHGNLYTHKVYGECYNRCGKRDVYYRTERCQPADGALPTLVDSKDSCDYYRCALCKNGIILRSHCWCSDPEVHYCLHKGGTAHLEEPHDFVKNVCTVCGRKQNDEYEYKEELVRLRCVADSSSDPVSGEYRSYTEHCCLGGTHRWSRRAVDAFGNVIPEDERDPWEDDGVGPTGGHCRFLDPTYEYCLCPYCTSGEPYPDGPGCWCPYMNESNYALVLKQKHITKKVTDLDLLDPLDDVVFIDGDCYVLDIDARCVEGVFPNLANLRSVQMPSVTNVGAQAFAYAFTNDTKLANVNFASLATAGDSAFLCAFYGCPLNTSVNFSSLADCGDGAFDGAFEGSQVASLSFPCLTNATGTLRFFGNTPCATITSLNLQTLVAASTNAAQPILDFSTMTNLQTLTLTEASADVFNNIGDMSNLSKLSRVNLYKMESVPLYADSHGRRHAPTNNPNCMIVVPDSLIYAWRAAAGWSDIAQQIVPFSNQVIIARHTVTFDMGDYAEPIPSTNVWTLESVTVPTSGVKYAYSLYGGGGTGYGFDLEGFYLDTNRTERYTGQSIMTNTTLYAKWTDNRAITFNSVTNKVVVYEADPELGLGQRVSVGYILLDTVKIGYANPSLYTYNNPFTVSIMNEAGELIANSEELYVNEDGYLRTLSSEMPEGPVDDPIELSEASLKVILSIQLPDGYFTVTNTCPITR